MGRHVAFVDQTGRIKFLWVSAPLVLLLTVFTQTAWPDDFIVAETIEQIGIVLLFACIIGRCWAALHIGGKKNSELVMSGPYHYTRNPLYLFSCLGLAGTGFMLESLVLGIVLFVFGYAVFQPVMKREDAHLETLFGSRHSAYAQRVPAFLPRFFQEMEPQSNDRLEFSQAVLKRTFLDACYFLLIFPLVEIIEWLHMSAQVNPFFLLY